MTIAARTSLIAALLSAFALLLLATPEARAADQGVVEVRGTTFSEIIKVDLERDLGAGTIDIPGEPGVKGWPVREILLFAQEATNRSFLVNSLEKNPILSREGRNDLPVNRNQVALESYDSKLPVYFIDDGVTTMRENNGQLSAFENLNPQISVSKSIASLGVEITKPGASIRLKAGASQTFQAKVSNPGGAVVNLSWSVDGVRRQSGTSATNGTFTFEFRKEGTFSVQVFASADGAAPTADSVTVTVGKPPAKKPEKKPGKDKPAETPTDSYGSGDPWGGDPYGGDPWGGDPGSSYPSTVTPPAPSPKPEQPKEEPPVPVDDGLETVSGQLVDPSQITAVVPSAETPAGAAGTEAGEADSDQSGWGGLSDGAMTALGIGALLGLGGLAEAGAFAGLRRFRLRP